MELIHHGYYEADKGKHFVLTEKGKAECVTEGYEVVYDYNGYTLSAGNHIVFPKRQIAESYMKNQEKKSWMKKHKLYIRTGIYEGVALKECRTHDNKQVYNTDWFYGIDCLQLGDLVEEEIIDDIIDALPPACMRTDCTQLGEPADHRIDENGKTRAVFATFKRIAENTWEYCGNCFRGENIQRGIEPAYV